MTFYTKEFFSSRSIDSFYPFVEVGSSDRLCKDLLITISAFRQIPFEIKRPEEHFHIPLLLSPFSYTTYR